MVLGYRSRYNIPTETPWQPKGPRTWKYSNTRCRLLPKLRERRIWRRKEMNTKVLVVRPWTYITELLANKSLSLEASSQLGGTSVEDNLDNFTDGLTCCNWAITLGSPRRCLCSAIGFTAEPSGFTAKSVGAPPPELHIFQTYANKMTCKHCTKHMFKYASIG